MSGTVCELSANFVSTMEKQWLGKVAHRMYAQELHTGYCWFYGKKWTNNNFPLQVDEATDSNEEGLSTCYARYIQEMTCPGFGIL